MIRSICVCATLLILGVIAQSAVDQAVADYYFQYSFADSQSWEAKESLLQAAIAWTPKNPDYYDHLGLLYFEWAATSNDKFAKYSRAVQQFEMAIAMNPVNYKFHLYHAIAQLRITDDISRFLLQLSNVTVLDPHNARAPKYRERVSALVVGELLTP